MDKYIELSNCKIFVKDMHSEKENALVFIHGNSLSSKSFEAQLNCDLFKDYRLIAFDFPGNGLSSKKKECYNFDVLSDTVFELIEKLNVHNFILIGHSFGGHIAVENTERFAGLKGLVTFGAPPLDIPLAQDAFLPAPEAQYLFMGELKDNEIKMLANAYLKNEDARLIVYEDIKNTDPKFREIIGQELFAGNYKNEVDIFRELSVPVAVFHADEDKFVNKDYLETIDFKNLWQNKIHIIPDAGHICQIDNSGVFNELLAGFVRGVF